MGTGFRGLQPRNELLLRSVEPKPMKPSKPIPLAILLLIGCRWGTQSAELRRSADVGGG